MQAIKAQIQRLLRRIGLYNRVKGSCLYDYYWRIADRDVIRERTREIEFYRCLLKGFEKGSLIFDIGANHGQKVDVFLRLGARVVAVEPDVTNQEILRQRFIKYRFRKKPVSLIGKAVSDRNDIETLWVDSPGSAKNTLSKKWVSTLRVDEERFGQTLSFAGNVQVETVTLEDLVIAFGTPFFVKIDVEGHEPSVLRGLRRVVPFLSFEVNLPEFLPEGLECVELLGGLAARGQFNYAVDCQRGLALENWVDHRQFLQLLNACQETSIEVIWKSTG